MVNCLSSPSASGAVYAGTLFPLLNPRDLASLGTTDKRLRRFVSEFVAMHFQGPTLHRIVGDYGYAPLGNVRNLTLLPRLYEVCHLEGEGEGLSRETLGAKMQIVEDRNLVKLFLRFTHSAFPVTPDTMNSITTLLDFATMFHVEHPELDACCLANVMDIPRAARVIREKLQSGNPIHSPQIEFFPLNPEDGAGHFHDRHMTVIPPEIRCVRTMLVYIRGPGRLLVSNHLATTFDRAPGTPNFVRPVIFLQGGTDNMVEHSAIQRQLKMDLPDQVKNLEELTINGERQ